jgi:hypothetical protein
MNTTEFLENLSRAVTVPTYQPRFKQSDQLALAYDEQKTKIVPMLLGIGQNYLLFREEQTVLAGTRSVSFPYRAIARAAKQVFYKGPDDDSPVELVKIELTQVQWRETDTGRPQAFVLFGDEVRLYPKPQVDGLIVFAYYFKPSKPVEMTYTATITAVGIDTLTVSTAVPKNIKIGSLCDITKVRPGHSLIYIDKTVSGIAGTVITLAGFDALNPITGVSIGDSISLAGETSILQYPEEAADVHVQATAVRILQTLSVPEQLKLAQDEYMAKVRMVREIMAPRIEDQPTIIMHGHPLLGGSFRPMPRVRVTDQ